MVRQCNNFIIMNDEDHLPLRLYIRFSFLFTFWRPNVKPKNAPIWYRQQSRYQCAFPFKLNNLKIDSK